jgi:hypothetical protein
MNTRLDTLYLDPVGRDETIRSDRQGNSYKNFYLKQTIFNILCNFSDPLTKVREKAD